MPYSLDFRQKVINFVENGGMITKAAHTFGIGIASIYRWLSRIIHQFIEKTLFDN